MISVLSSVLTLFLVLSIYIRYSLWLSWAKSVETYTEYDTLRTTGLWKSMVWEIIVCAISPQPFLNGLRYTEEVVDWDTTVEYEINDILLWIMFIRLYLPIRFSFYLTDLMSPRT